MIHQKKKKSAEEVLEEVRKKIIKKIRNHMWMARGNSLPIELHKHMSLV